VADALSLLIDGRLYGGWTGVSVSRSIETVSGAFEVQLADRWLGQELRWPIRPGMACEARIGDDSVVSGYVDEAELSLDDGSHSIRITGRDKTGDLVDCSAVHSPGQWSGLRLEEIARILVRPFGVEVRALTDTGAPFSPFKLQPGESVFESIERMCRMRAVLAMSDGHGGLLLSRAGTDRCAEDLREGKNLLSASAQYSMKDRHSEYIVLGQSPSKDGDSADVAAHPKASARDAGVPRHRPLVVMAEGASHGRLGDRAEWESSVRAGRALRVTASVQGWRQNDGSLWPINRLVRVVSETLGLDDILLIASTRFSLDERGSRTEMSLSRPDAYRLLEELPKGKKGAASGLPPGTEVITSEDQLK